MTYGQVKLRLTQAFPGVSLDLIEGFINDRYAEILGELPWTRLNVQMTLQTTAPYSTGTVAVVNGSNAITLSGGTWTAAMSGMKFYLVAPPAAIDSPYPDPAVGPIYTFTFVTGTTGTLDRAYGEATNTAAPYSIFQNIYTLPANCGMWREDRKEE